MNKKTNEKVEWEIASEIGKRSKASRKLKTKFRDRGEFWKIGFGDYHRFFAENNLEKRIDFEDLRGVEKVMLDQSLSILNKKEEKGDDSPVVVDFGGMYSLSFLRIAAFLEENGSLISNGKIVVVVTNLEFTEEYGLKTAGKGNNDITDSQQKLVQDYRHLVHYLKSDAAELRHQKVKLPDGKELKLDGKIDLLHENWALTHCKKNDVDFPLIARSMSQYGTIMLGSQFSHPSLKESPKDSSIRKRAHVLGKGNILKEGFEEQDFDKEAKYKVYLASEAPEIKV